MNQTIEETDLFIEFELFFDDEPSCELQHTDHSACGVKATHRLKYCVRSFLLCTSGAVRQRREMNTKGTLCSRCRKPAIDCWRITPI